MPSNREARWDNVKFFMILCVVIGHTFYEFIGKDTQTLKGLYLFLYTFHMPVFLFLTGMFSLHAVREKRYDRVIQYLAIYLFMKLLDYLGGCLTAEIRMRDFLSPAFLREMGRGLLAERSSFHLFWEDGPGWYALAVAVFLLVTIQIQSADRKTVLAGAILLGCLAGLDNHLGNHFASMRLCTYYPVFLAGFYTAWRQSGQGEQNARFGSDREGYLSRHRRSPERRVGAGERLLSSKLLSIAVLGVVFAVCLVYAETLYPYVNLLKGKSDYMAMGLGAGGIVLRLLGYGLWYILVRAVINLCPKKEHFYTWLGTRSMAIFIWHKFLLTILLKLCYGKYFIRQEIPHYILPAALCVAVAVTVLAAYLPELRMGKRQGSPFKG